MSLDTHFEFSLATFMSPVPDPARNIRTSPLYTHLIVDVLSILPNSLPWFVLVLLWRNWQLYLDLRPLQLRIETLKCACLPRTVVGIITNLAPQIIGYNLDLNVTGFTSAMIALISADSWPDLISETTPIDRHTRMKKYDSNCTSRKNWFDLAGIHCTLSEPEPLNDF
jgi:hypothetical protein